MRSRQTLTFVDRKNQNPKKDAVLEDAAPARRRSSRNRPVTRPPQKDEMALETYEQAPSRGAGDDARGEASRPPDSIERPVRDQRSARDEP